jgi:hypothetical protein
MSTKEQLVSNIKEWIKCDNDIKELQKMMKATKERKKKLTDGIVQVMKNKEIDCFDLNDGKLIYSQSKTKSTINKQHLMVCLEKYFKESASPNMAEDLTNFILDNREIKVKDVIRRKVQKNVDE